jgi:hypothetical protein
MYARLITMSGAVGEKREQAIQMVNGTVLPMLRQVDGFAGYSWCSLGRSGVAPRSRCRTPQRPERPSLQSAISSASDGVEPDVVLREARCGGVRGRDIAQL